MTSNSGAKPPHNPQRTTMTTPEPTIILPTRLEFQEEIQCYRCGAPILWGELYAMSYPEDFLCAGCSDRPLFRNGPYTAASAAQGVLRRELNKARDRLWELIHARELLDDAFYALEDLAKGDIIPPEIRTALTAITELRKVYPMEDKLPHITLRPPQGYAPDQNAIIEEDPTPEQVRALTDDGTAMAPPLWADDPRHIGYTIPCPVGQFFGSADVETTNAWMEALGATARTLREHTPRLMLNKIAIVRRGVKITVGYRRDGTPEAALQMARLFETTFWGLCAENPLLQKYMPRHPPGLAR